MIKYSCHSIFIVLCLISITSGQYTSVYGECKTAQIGDTFGFKYEKVVEYSGKPIKVSDIHYCLPAVAGVKALACDISNFTITVDYEEIQIYRDPHLENSTIKVIAKVYCLALGRARRDIEDPKPNKYEKEIVGVNTEVRIKKPHSKKHKKVIIKSTKSNLSKNDAKVNGNVDANIDNRGNNEETDISLARNRRDIEDVKPNKNQKEIVGVNTEKESVKIRKVKNPHNQKIKKVNKKYTKSKLGKNDAPVNQNYNENVNDNGGNKEAPEISLARLRRDIEDVKPKKNQKEIVGVNSEKESVKVIKVKKPRSQKEKKVNKIPKEGQNDADLNQADANMNNVGDNNKEYSVKDKKMEKNHGKITKNKLKKVEKSNKVPPAVKKADKKQHSDQESIKTVGLETSKKSKKEITYDETEVKNKQNTVVEQHNLVLQNIDSKTPKKAKKQRRSVENQEMTQNKQQTVDFPEHAANTFEAAPVHAENYHKDVKKAAEVQNKLRRANHVVVKAHHEVHKAQERALRAEKKVQRHQDNVRRVLHDPRKGIRHYDRAQVKLERAQKQVPKAYRSVEKASKGISKAEKGIVKAHRLQF